MNRENKILIMPVADVYPLYVTKVERKGQHEADVLRVMSWLTGYSDEQIAKLLAEKINFAEFFNQAPELNPKRKLLHGRICGVKVEDMAPGTMQEVRFLDKLVDDVAKGKAWEKILPE